MILSRPGRVPLAVSESALTKAQRSDTSPRRAISSRMPLSASRLLLKRVFSSRMRSVASCLAAVCRASACCTRSASTSCSCASWEIRVSRRS